MNPTITAVIVTYAERWNCLSKLLANLCNNPIINNIIIVDNNSKYDVSRMCSEKNHSKVDVISMPVNTGSAGGFAAGIKAAYGYESDYVMLFDDDTLPVGNAISIMLERLIQINISSESLINAIVPNRNSQFIFLRNKINSKEHWLINESIVGLNIFNLIQRHILKYKHFRANTIETNIFNYGLAAYGGLLFHKNLCDIIGYPDKEYVLYYDDIDYTNRILTNNGNIWLCSDLFMDDIEYNYSSNMMTRPFIGFILADSDTKVYYQLRNQIYFEYRYMSNCKYLFLINAAIFTVLTTLIAISLFKLRRLKVILSAIKHGLLGKLGVNTVYTLA